MRAASAGLWLVALLSAWLGAAILSTLVAQAAFAVLPSRTLAGALVGRVLPQLFLTGIALGALALVLAPTSAAGWTIRGSAFAMTTACVLAQFIIAPRIERVRVAIGGPVDALDLVDPRRQDFGRLHGLSVLCLAVAMVAALVLVAMVARTILRSSSPNQVVLQPHDASATR